MSELDNLLKSESIEDVKLGLILYCQKYSRATVRRKFSASNPYMIRILFNKPFLIKAKDYWIYTYIYPEYISDQNDDRLTGRSYEIEIYEL